MLLEQEFTELESYIVKKDTRNDKVSKSDVAWQIDHSLKVINGIYSKMKESNPADFKFSMSVAFLYIRLRNSIPRGAARTPKSVDAAPEITIEDIQRRLTRAKERMMAFEELPEKAYFEHPYFGHLKKSTTRWFLKLHTEHHLKIIRDILA